MNQEITIPVAKNPSRNWLRKLFCDWESTQMVITFFIIAIVAIWPLFNNTPYVMGILILTTLYAFVGISWNIIAGFAGQLLIAHISFLAFGAFTTIVLLNTYGVSPWIGLPVSGLTAAMLGLFIAMITLRYGLKADYFALFSIAMMVALRAIFLKWDLVGGTTGIGLSLSNPTFERMVFKAKEPYLYIILGLLVIGVLIQFFIHRSKIGKYFFAIREDEDAAAALGVNTSLYKTLALVIGSFLSGVSGGFYIMYVGFVEPPQVFDLALNVEIVMASPIIGGLGSLVGPILGAFLNKPLSELIRSYVSAGTSGTSLIVYGSFLVLSILFLPRGLAGVVQDIYLKIRSRWGEQLPGGPNNDSA
jgi:branched-chain amino acid transport system permease protein